MAKVMLVEDDNNLREIYQARLTAEGYQIVSAKDGEEALQLAVKEKPDLILLDVMMPKVSGFEFLDILRSTENIKYTKVIMMTALSQAEDKERAEKMGVNRYLVKSQVTLEDMAKAVRDVLEEAGDITGEQQSQTTASAAPTTSATPPAVASTTDTPVSPAPRQLLTEDPTPSAEPAQTPPPATPATDNDNTEQQLLNDAANALQEGKQTPSNPIKVTSGATPDFKDDDDDSDDDGVKIAKKKVITPLNDPTTPNTNLETLLAKEEANEQASNQAAAGNIRKVVVSSDLNKDPSSSEDDDIPAGSPLNNPLPINPQPTDQPPTEGLKQGEGGVAF